MIEPHNAELKRRAVGLHACVRKSNAIADPSQIPPSVPSRRGKPPNHGVRARA